ncbi:MAG: hypothetical protein KY429_11560 [Actinobacteria bacterium]|nr:hypothetical protein [Actinomycetota bacterium]
MSWALLILTLLVFAVGVVVYFAVRIVPDGYVDQAPEHWLAYTQFAVGAVGTLAGGGLGFLLSRRRPNNPIGWFLLIGTCLSALNEVLNRTWLYGTYVERKIRLPWMHIDLVDLKPLELFYLPSGILGLGLFFILLLILFPEGRFETRAGRVVGYIVMGLISLSVLEVVIGPNLGGRENPLGVPWLYELIAYRLSVLDQQLSLSYLAFLLTIPVSGVYFVARYLRSRGERRLQMKWLGLAGSIAALGLLVTLVAYYSKGFFDVYLLDFSWADWSDLVFAVGFNFVPIAAAIAIFKYRLYDIEVILRRSLIFGSLALFITAGYIGGVVIFGSVLGGNRGFLPSVAATGLVALAFQPVRARSERVANRLVYGKRAAPYDALLRMTEEMRTTRPVEDILPSIAETVAAVTGARGVRVRLALSTGESLEGTWSPGDFGADGSSAATFPIQRDGVWIGDLEILKRKGESITPDDEAALNALMRPAFLALENIRLAAELQQRLEEKQAQAAALQDSLRRLTNAALRTRLAFQREVHEGVASNLAEIESVIPRLGSADARTLTKLIDEASKRTEDALEKVREIARGIFPPLLADKGLIAALEAEASRYGSIDLSLDGSLAETRPQAQVESSIYFCCREALRRLAGQSRASLRVHRVDGNIHFEISIDGGADFLPPGTAMDMKDRIDALGGSLVVHGGEATRKRPGNGLVLEGTVPA